MYIFCSIAYHLESCYEKVKFALWWDYDIYFKNIFLPRNRDQQTLSDTLSEM